jgi:hypothetical protein
MVSSIWICFDLGVRGDYTSLYTWLDERGAKECAGNGVAFLKYEHEDLVDRAIKLEFRRMLAADPSARVYLIYRDREANKLKGVWIMGRRKGAPWAGFGPTPSPSDEEEDQ